MRPAWDELRMNPNRPISRNDHFGTDSMIGTSQFNADRPMELDLRSRRRSVSGLDRSKAITDSSINSSVDSRLDSSDNSGVDSTPIPASTQASIPMSI